MRPRNSPYLPLSAPPPAVFPDGRCLVLFARSFIPILP